MLSRTLRRRLTEPVGLDEVVVIRRITSCSKLKELYFEIVVPAGLHEADCTGIPR